MANVGSVVKPGETIDGRAYPEGEVTLILSYEESRWLRELANCTNSANDDIDQNLWRALSDANIPLPDTRLAFYAGGAAVFGPKRGPE
jgi:hypothetical protein